ncbi:forkhead box protein J1-B-like [Colius striatus]|uniref:forkhead box protein J1-B-like n=1 Tax=Colius striatus TaxID=57412 RepID=UPI002B1D5EFD|nr:forkhead box protein J1-B-like [Colius striatus]
MPRLPQPTPAWPSPPAALSHSPCQPISSSASRTQHHTMVLSPELAQDTGHRSNPSVRPPYTYASLICMAMEASQKPSISLSDIYKWIRDNFSYFRHADPSWQRSIRRKLSLNKSFIRVPQEKGETGRGGFWTLHPEYAQRLKNIVCKRRSMPPAHSHAACPATAPQGTGSLTTTDTSSGTYTSILNVNRELQQLLKEFEEDTSNQTLAAADGKAGQRHKKPSPKPTARLPRLCSPVLLSQEKQPELGALEEDFDCEAICNTNSCGEFDTKLSRDIACKQRRMPQAQSHAACPATAPQGTASLTTTDTSSGTYTSLLTGNREVQQRLKEFEEATSNQTLAAADGKAGQKRKKPSPAGMAKVTWLCRPVLLSQEQQPDLGPLQGDLDWEAFFYTNRRGGFDSKTSSNSNVDSDSDSESSFITISNRDSPLLELTEPNSPAEHEPELTAHGHHIHQLQDGQEQLQLLTEASVNNLDFDETFMATYFLQQELDKETNDCLYY